VAYFFHASLQGVAAAPGAVALLDQLRAAGLRAGAFGDGQQFTLAQTLRAFRSERKLADVGDVLTPQFVVLSYQSGVRQPSASLSQALVAALAAVGLEPRQVLHVSHRLEADLVPARQAGFRTALVAADENCTHVDKAVVRDPERRPDRLITDLLQIRQIAGV
jgi:FMN phosphatase YigB (HAD superfamily)